MKIGRVSHFFTFSLPQWKVKNWESATEKVCVVKRKSEKVGKWKTVEFLTFSLFSLSHYHSEKLKNWESETNNVCVVKKQKAKKPESEKL